MFAARQLLLRRRRPRRQHRSQRRGRIRPGDDWERSGRVAPRAPWAERAGRPEPTVEARDAVEDVRWLRRDEALPEGDTDVHPLFAITICPGTIEQRDPDRIAFAYRADYDEAIVPRPIGTLSHAGYATLEFGAFRRGGDGHWRRLTGAIPLTARGWPPTVARSSRAPDSTTAYGSRRCNAGRAAPAT